MNETTIEDFLYAESRRGIEPLIEFKRFGKIPRLRRDMVVTEKIDGTNAAVGIIKITAGMAGHPDLDSPAVTIVRLNGGLIDGKFDNQVEFAVYAQSRRRLISVHDDNYGFAGWVDKNAETLVRDLGPGLHFGEWWGQGIQRNYGMSRKIFSLFNVHKWGDKQLEFETENLGVVPVVCKWTFDTAKVAEALETLRVGGSLAAPGFMQPEGIVVFHPAASVLFKATLDADEVPKSVSQKRRLEAVADAA